MNDARLSTTTEEDLLVTSLHSSPAGAKGEQPITIAREWLESFSNMLRKVDLDRLPELFVEDAWWRDLVALSWDLVSFHGLATIRRDLLGTIAAQGIRKVHLSSIYEPAFAEGPEDQTEIVFAFDFLTAAARCRGFVRLRRVESNWRAWLILTDATGLIGHEEPVTTIENAAEERFNRAQQDRPTLAELRARRRDFTASDPDVVVVGAGHSGLMLAARLERIGLSTLVVDREARLGNNWRDRYNGLALHDTLWRNSFPYLDFPRDWPVFIPKDLMGDWIEAYEWILDLRTWTDSEVTEARYNPESSRWTVTIRRGESRRTLQAAHLVFATGNSGIALVPAVPGADQFRGVIAHSSSYPGGSFATGKRIVVVGSATSAHDIAQDAYEMGAAEITMVQRGPTYVMTAARGLPLVNNTHPGPGEALERADLLSLATPPSLVGRFARKSVELAAEADADLLAGLEARGFQLTLGEGNGGHNEIALRRVGGYYIDKGCSQLIVDGHVRIQRGEVSRFTEDTVVFSDGSVQEADIVVFATGYVNMIESVRPICGDEVADMLTPVWGLDTDGELRGIYRRTKHPRLWFVGGAFGQVRRHSVHLAIQMRAIEDGLMSDAPIARPDNQRP